MTDFRNTLFVAAAKAISVLENFGFEGFAVGGFVRDLHLGREASDVDVATNARPEDVMKAAEASGLRHFTCDNALNHGTVTLVVDGVNVEVTTFRFDVATDGRNATVRFADRVEDDLARRDFTFNAMALELNGRVVDPFHGTTDLDNGLVRFVGSADERIKEDALRMLRAVRFATRFGFTVDEKGKAAIHKNTKMVHRLSPERIADELFKVLASDKPSAGFRMLHELHLLGEVLPEVEALVGMEQRTDFHHKDVFEHTMMVLDSMAEMTDNVVLRFAALLHDIGKPSTRTFTNGVGYQFIGHEIEGATMAFEVCKRLRLSVDDTKMVRRLVRDHLRLAQLKDCEATDRAVRRLLRKFADRYTEPTFADYMDNLIILTRADMTSHNPDKVATSEFRLNTLVDRIEALTVETPVESLCSPLDGNEIMALGVPQGREVGEVKSMLTDAVVDGTLDATDKDGATKLVLETLNT